MNKDLCHKMIKETFEKEFEEERYVNFIGNLLNSYEEKNKSYVIHERFSNCISSLEKFGEYKDSKNEIDLLIVRVKRGYQLNKARGAQKNIVAEHLGKYSKDAAIVAFVSPDKKDWRFSLIKYEITSNIEEKFTPSKRWSFLVGENESSHTAKTRLVPILANDKHNPTLEELEKAFDIEVVTNEFYKKYSNLYLETKDAITKIIEKSAAVKKEFEAKKIDQEDFSKKLLGQIIFLYFLQKKGWFGVDKDSNWGTGSKIFLREKFNEGGYQNFFNEILEPLFYEALRVDRRNRQDLFKKFNCRIPFLNSGLFDPIGNYDWENLKIPIPNELFSNQNKSKEGDVGTGILDIFDRYNFTVKEDEPLEKEVAIDPEMLGKVFENLLESDDRKKSGAFYTPREIVHYMCQISLVNYLNHELYPSLERKAQDFRDHLEKFIRLGSSIKEKEAFTSDYDIGGYSLPASIYNNAKLIDDALAQIKICDPAVGSGAFLVGMMAEIVNARNTLSSYLGNRNRTIYKLKRECIENTLYGVDKKSIAVEIAKLRLWLSLVVDEENIKEITPLPNLYYKIACGDSLLYYPYQHRKLEELEKKKNSFLNEINHARKEKLKNEIDQTIQNIFQNSSKSLGYTVSFDFWINFSEIFNRNKKGFDVVITNPPYVRHEEIKEYKPNFKMNYELYNSTSDLYTYFYELSYKILNEGGFSTFITSNKWLRAKYGERLREFLSECTKLSHLIDFGGHQVFPSATVDTNILMFQKTSPNNLGIENFVKIEDDFDSKKDLSSYINKNAQPIKQSSLGKVSWVLENPSVLRIKEKVEAKGTPLKHWDVKINRGITTGCNEAFIIDTATKEQLCKEDHKSAEIIKPVLRGRDIDKYHCTWANKWIISTFPSLKLNINHYPAIKKYLKTFGGKLEQSGKKGSRKKTNNEWFETQDSIGFHEDFEKEKIVWQRITQDISFSYDFENLFALDSMVFMCGKNLKSILSILNSKLINFYLKTYIHKLGKKGFLLSNQYVERIPIPEASKEIQNLFVKLVDKIISLKNSKNFKTSQSKQNAVKHLQEEIDQMVYNLYGLTNKEVQIIEKDSSLDNLEEQFA